MLNWWENSKKGSINKSQYRTLLKETNTKVTSLDGKWDFKWFKDIALIDQEKYLEVFKSENYEQITVPGVWELNGYGKPQYENSHHHMPHTPPKIISDNPVGFYRKKVQITKGNFNYLLRLHGVDSIAKIWVNKKLVGVNKNARVTSEFDITENIIDGGNEIYILVVKYSDVSYLECQDMWRFGGIFRSVEIVEEPKDNIRDIYISAIWSEKASRLLLDFSTNLDCDVSITLFDKKDQIYQDSKNLKVKNHILELKNIVPWSSENPKLYNLIIDTPNQKFYFKVGFKKIEIRKNILYVNDVPIKIRGVNMHDFTPKKGRVISYQETLKNLKIMKENNINAIRTSHYPKNSWFYDLCDELGFWVMDEADIESHGAQFAGNWGDLANRQNYWKHFLEKAQQMILRDRNHVSIISFSLGNEAGFGENFRKMAKYIKSNTQNIFIHYEGDFNCEVVDVSSNMYSWIEPTSKILTKNHLKDLPVQTVQNDLQLQVPDHLPHIECEYAHAMGNGPGSLMDYWNIFYQKDQYIGGFIWEWFDHGLKLPDFKDFLYGSDFGHKKHDGNFCIDGLLHPSGKASPGLIETKSVYSPIQIKTSRNEIIVTNRYNFLDTKNHQMQLIFKSNNGSIISQEVISLPSIPRHDSKSFIIEKKNADFVVVKIFNLENSNILTTSLKLKKFKWKIKKIENKEILFIKNENGCLIVDNNLQKFKVSLDDGSINIEKEGKNIVAGNIMNFWRPTIDNDFHLSSKWKSVYHLNVVFNKLRSIKYEIDKDKKVIVKCVIDVSCPTQGWSYQNQITYTIAGKVVQVYLSSSRKINVKILDTPIFQDAMIFRKRTKGEIVPFTFPRIGFDFKILKEFKDVLYLGRGPHENYPDSKHGSYYDFYKTNIDKLWFDYVKPQDNGNRQDTNYLELLSTKSSIKIISNAGFDFQYQKYAIDSIEKAQHPSELRKDNNHNLLINFQNGPIHSNICGPLPMYKYWLSPNKFKMKYQLIID